MRTTFLELHRNLLFAKVTKLFSNYFVDNKIETDQLLIEFETLLDDYDKKAYPHNISIDKRKRLILLFESMKIHPLGLEGIQEFSKEIGIDYNPRDGWFINEKEEINKFDNLAKPGDEKIDF